MVALASVIGTPNSHLNAGSLPQPLTASRSLSFEERVAYQYAIEEVYWRHRIWPKENPTPKPTLDSVISRAQIENKVQDYLRKSQMVAEQRGWPITSSELQRQLDSNQQH
jgi:hypothetical protein